MSRTVRNYEYWIEVTICMPYGELSFFELKDLEKQEKAQREKWRTRDNSMGILRDDKGYEDVRGKYRKRKLKKRLS